MIDARLTQSPDVFNQRYSTNIEQRDLVRETYVKRVSRMSWNKSLGAPIVPFLHGTDLFTARNICQTGNTFPLPFDRLG